MYPINESTVSSLLSVVDQGLTKGLGSPVPGHMCVEAAVCYSLGLPHSDDPLCVAPSLRKLKIQINDANWSSNAARAKGLRRLAVAQLGTKDTLNEKEFAERVAIMLVKTTLADIVEDETLRNKCRAVETIEEAREAAVAVNNAPAVYATATAAAYYAAAYADADYAARAAVYAATAANAVYYAAANAVYYAAAYAADYAATAAATARAAAGDKVLSDFCELVVQILIEMKAPGCEYLYLTEN